MNDVEGRKEGKRAFRSKAEQKVRLKLQKQLSYDGGKYVPDKQPKEEKPLAQSTVKTLSTNYYNTKSGFRGIAKTYRDLKERGEGVTERDVTKFTQQQEPYLQNKVQRAPKKWNTIWAEHPGDQYQIDNMHYNRYAYNGYNWIFNCIDVNSRKAGGVALSGDKHKLKGDKLIPAFQYVVQAYFGGRYPKILDMDREFYNKEFIKFCQDKGIQLHFTQVGHLNKNAIVERFNGTLAQIIQRWRTSQHEERDNKANWVEELPNFFHNYNNTRHTTTKATPEDIWEGKAKNTQEITRLRNTLKVGDIVKRKILITVDESENRTAVKGDLQRFSRENYELVEKIGNRWKLKDIETGKILTEGDTHSKHLEFRDKPELFLEYQLQKVSDIRTKKTPEEYEAEEAKEEQEKEAQLPEEQQAKLAEKGQLTPVESYRDEPQTETLEQKLEPHGTVPPKNPNKPRIAKRKRRLDPVVKEGQRFIEKTNERKKRRK